MTTYTGGSGSDDIKGGAGDDTITGGAGDDKLYGRGGNDIIYDDADIYGQDDPPDSDLIYGGDGNDTLIHNQGLNLQDVDTLSGDAGDDHIIYNGLQTGDKADGGSGTDTLSVTGDPHNTHTLYAVWNASNFDIQVDGVNTLFASGIERVEFTSGEGNDTLIGSVLDDKLTSYGGADVMQGGAGNDVVAVNNDYTTTAGATIDGGDGIDTFEFDDFYNNDSSQNSTVPITIDLLHGTYTIGGTSIGTVTHFEQLDVSTSAGDDRLIGGNRDDVLNGGDGNNTISGNGGNDTIIVLGGLNFAVTSVGSNTLDGGAGNDVISVQSLSSLPPAGVTNTLIGGSGDDILHGGAEVDTMDGGSGNDTFYYTAGDTINDSSGIDTILTSEATLDLTAFATIENVALTGGYGTVVTGNKLDNTISSAGVDFASLTASGGGGDDHLIGGNSLDHLSGGTGDDTIEGGNYNDTLDGGTGNDTVHGGDFDDTIEGGDGNDRLEGNDGADAIQGGTGNDIIYGDTHPIDAHLGFGSGKVSKASGAGDTAATAVSLDGTFTLAANNDVSNATQTPHTSVTAHLSKDGTDFYKVGIANAGEKLIADVDRLGLPGGLSTRVSIIDPDGNVVATSLNFGFDDRGAGGSSGDGEDGYIEWITTKAGTYTIQVAEYNGFVTNTGTTYVLNVSVGEPGGNDVLDGNAGDDKLYGGNLNDVLDGGTGTNLLDGGLGEDTVSYADATAAVTVSLAVTGTQDTGGAGKDKIVNVENLVGSAFNDTLTGDKNDNVLDGGLGNDVLDGGAGNDTVTYATAGSAISIALGSTKAQATGGAGKDTLISIENVIGSAFGDTLTGNDGADMLSGGDGDDLLSGGKGNDTLDGGAGNDTALYVSATSAVAVDLALSTAQNTGGAGTDTLVNIENLIGGAGNDTLSGDAGSNRLEGGAGNDTLVGRAGDDVLKGGAGTDTLDGGLGNDTADYSDATAVTVDLATTGAQNTGGGGKDTLVGIENLVGGAGKDVFTGSAVANALAGGAGDDTLNGGNGDDVLDGGSGNDVLSGGSGNDTASYADAAHGVAVDLAKTGKQDTGGAGIDTLSSIENLLGSSFADKLYGDAGGNILSGGDASDKLYGRVGDDTLSGGLGDDLLDGGTGIDTASYADAPGQVPSPGLQAIGVTVDLSLSGAQDTVTDGKDTLVDIENLVGSAFSDTLTGDDKANHLDGAMGSDTIKGGGGNDLIEGGTIPPGANTQVTTTVYDNDTIDGGDGNDTVTYHLAGSAVVVDLYGYLGSGSSTGGGGYDQIKNVENAVGSLFDDTLSGTADANILTGGAGNDVLDGRDGDDLLDGGAGIDRVTYADAGAGVTVDLSQTGPQQTGGSGRDTLKSIEQLTGSGYTDVLTGSSGANVIDGGAGNDQISGGGGNDTLDGGLGDDVIDGGAGANTVLYQGTYQGYAATVDLAIVGPQNTGNGSDTLIGIQNVVGGYNADNLAGNDAANVLTGAEGNDTLSGRGGDDILLPGYGTNALDGGAGNDVVSFADMQPIPNQIDLTSYDIEIDLAVTAQQFFMYDHTYGSSVTLASVEGVIGSGFDDVLLGDAGANVIDGGGGNDTLTGRGGGDTFRFDTALDASRNVATVTDFTPGEDTIELASAIFTGLQAGALAASAFYVGGASHDANDRILYNSAVGSLSYDDDGTGHHAAVRFATLDPGLHLTAGVFKVS